MPAVLGSRPSDIITTEEDDEMARMSDISNVTLGNRIAELSGGVQTSGVKKSPFLQRDVSWT